MTRLSSRRAAWPARLWFPAGIDVAVRRIRQKLISAPGILAAGAMALFALTPFANAEGQGARSAPQLRPSVAASPSQPAQLPIIHGVKLQMEGSVARLEFAVAGRSEPSAFVLADPGRLIVDLPETLFRLQSAQGQTRNAIVSAFRFGLVSAGRSRIVVDLGRPARIVRAVYEPMADSAGRIVLELQAVERPVFLELARLGRMNAAAAAAPGNALAPRSLATGQGPGVPAGKGVVIAIDPGHGGIDSGATSPSRLTEKDITLAFARELAKILADTGRYRPFLTREDDVFVPLGERVRLARGAGAKLFLSIHADTLNEKYVSGATVYTLSDRASDAHAARLAAKENRADSIAGHVSEDGKNEVGDILADLTRRETRTFSHVFARSLVAYWKGAGRINKNPIRSAGFSVLRAHDVPSVLLEMGYLSSKTDAEDLASPQWRARAAGSVVRAIDEFFAAPGKRQSGLNAGEKPSGSAKGVAAASQGE